eukprot:1835807-Pyramimonas_sp.AAC.2
MQQGRQVMHAGNMGQGASVTMGQNIRVQETAWTRKGDNVHFRLTVCCVTLDKSSFKRLLGRCETVLRDHLQECAYP